MASAKVYSLDALRETRQQAATFEQMVVQRQRGPNARPSQQLKTNYLLQAGYRKTSVQELLRYTDDEARAFLERIRWGSLGEGKQICPKCGTIDSHFWCKTPKRWKCRAKMCGHQFTVLQGTRLHGSKKPYQDLLALLFEFVECRRRSKSEPPRRPNIEPGVEADFEMVGCG
jgi:hypothetical protein